MSRRAWVVLLIFVAAAATLVAGFLLIGTAQETAIWLIVGGMVLVVVGALGIGFLRPMPTDEEMKPRGKGGKGGGGGTPTFDVGEIFDAFR